MMNILTAYRTISFKWAISAGFIVTVLFLSGCSSYVTPGAGANLSQLTNAGLTEADIQEMLNRKPVSPFPVRIAVVRIQESGYYSHGNQSYGNGNYSVITNRDIETDENFKKLERLPMITAVATMSQILIPRNLRTDKELRLAAAKLHTDMLLVYTINTSFRIKDHEIGPLGVITLGTLPNQEALVTSTASCIIYDVRTGYTYGVAESTAYEKQMASIWASSRAIDESRIKAEKKAFLKMLDEFSVTWKGIIEQYASQSGQK